MEGLNQTKVDWDIIIQTIKDGKCVICLGPELFSDERGSSLEKMLGSYLRVEDHTDIRNFYQDDGLFLFRSEEGKTRVYYQLRRFYDQVFPITERILQKVAQIPVRLLINLTPDQKLAGVFSTLHLKCKQDFYWKNRTPLSSAQLPTRQAPLIYNILGSIQERDSLVLTYQDMFDYFDSMLGARSMPTELKKVISETDNFIFLGVRFERWYMQLLLRILAKYNDRDSFLRYASSLNINDKVITFCQEQFRITFVEEDIGAFVSILYQKCQEEDLLREVGQASESPMRRLTQLVAKAETEEAIQELKLFLEGTGDPGEDLLDEVVVLQERLNRLSRRMRLGSIDERDAEVRRNQITEALLGIISKARNFE